MRGASAIGRDICPSSVACFEMLMVTGKSSVQVHGFMQLGSRASQVALSLAVQALQEGFAAHAGYHAGSEP